MKYEVLCVPFLGHKSVQLLHKDNYLMANVKFSTFTMNDDILVMVGGALHVFSGQGNPIKIKISEDDNELLKSERLQIVKISSNTLVEAG
jgi:hypothetical protein